MEKKASDALKSSHGCAMPAPGRATGKDGARAIWTGLGQAFLVGPVPQAELSGTCTLTDQSDAWAVLRLEGEKAIEVLARLTPLDLRPAHFKRGHTARSLLGHMTASFTRIGANSWMIMVFRSMADTAVHELTDAMQGVAARNEIVSA
jgi:sarcosine oxidase subunit gamma